MLCSDASVDGAAVWCLPANLTLPPYSLVDSLYMQPPLNNRLRQRNDTRSAWQGKQAERRGRDRQTHTRTHTHIHTHTHTRTHTLAHTHSHTHTHARTHTLSHALQQDDRQQRLAISVREPSLAIRSGESQPLSRSRASCLCVSMCGQEQGQERGQASEEMWQSMSWRTIMLAHTHTHVSLLCFALALPLFQFEMNALTALSCPYRARIPLFS